MAKNARQNKKNVDPAKTGLQGIQDAAATSNKVVTQTTEEAGTTEPESTEKKLQVSTGQNNGKETNNATGTQLDTERKSASTGEAGREADNPVEENDLQDSFEEAAKVIKALVDLSIDESGILDEPKETTEKRNRIALEVFAKNEQCKTLYFTADLIPFFVKSDAFRHGAGTLKDDTIVTINRK